MLGLPDDIKDSELTEAENAIDASVGGAKTSVRNQ